MKSGSGPCSLCASAAAARTKIAPGEHRVQRHVPQLPYTTEIEAFERLKRQLAAYRVVFGQPRQEELVTLLDRADLDIARLRNWTIDLSPLVTRGAISRAPRRTS